MDTSADRLRLHATQRRSRRIAVILGELQGFLVDVDDLGDGSGPVQELLELPLCPCGPVYALADSIAQGCPVHGQEADHTT